MIYYTIVSIFGYFNQPEQVPSYFPANKFLVLIPAVNEAQVIKNPVQALLKQKYPKELYEVYVIADHCTDDTAKIAKRCGAKVITTKNNPDFARYGIGKANTLDYGLHQTNWHDYDYMLVVDSDNFVSNNLLQRLNDYAIHFNLPEALQSKLLSTQGRGFINTGLNLSFMRSHRFQQQVESYYGCASILGTGFATRVDVLEQQGGFRFKTLVEDEYEELSIITRGGAGKIC